MSTMDKAERVWSVVVLKGTFYKSISRKAEYIMMTRVWLVSPQGKTRSQPVWGQHAP